MPLKQSTKSSKNVLLILAMALFIVALSLVILSSLNPTQRKAFSLTSGSYADGYNAAREQAKKLGLPMVDIPTMNAGGIVTAINGNELTVETNFFVDQKVDGIGNSRKITLVKDGKIKIRSQANSEDMIKAQKDFQKEMQNFDGKGLPPKPPMPFDVKDGNMSDIAVGDSVSVQSTSDVRLAENISATEIDVIKATEAPATK